MHYCVFVKWQFLYLFGFVWQKEYTTQFWEFQLIFGFLFNGIYIVYFAVGVADGKIFYLKQIVLYFI